MEVQTTTLQRQSVQRIDKENLRRPVLTFSLVPEKIDQSQSTARDRQASFGEVRGVRDEAHTILQRQGRSRSYGFSCNLRKGIRGIQDTVFQIMPVRFSVLSMKLDVYSQTPVVPALIL